MLKLSENTSLVLIILFSAIIFSISNFLNYKKEMTFVKAGLEQCPISKDSQKTIWVKDCEKYLEITK